MFIVRCPECKQTMRYQAINTAPISEKKKKCVYCGHTFKIHPNYHDSRILREEKDNTTTALFHNAKNYEKVEELKKKEEKEKSNFKYWESHIQLL